MCTQRRFRSDCAHARCISDSQGCKVSSCGQGRLWLDCADVQTDLSLHWAHVSKVRFLTFGLKCSSINKTSRRWNSLWWWTKEKPKLIYWLIYLGHRIRLLKGLQRYLCLNTIRGGFEQGRSDMLKGIARDTYTYVHVYRQIFPLLITE